jgi:hypothetical protein
VDGRPVETITEAKEAMEILRHQRRENRLPTDRRKPRPPTLTWKVAMPARSSHEPGRRGGTPSLV